MKIVGEMWSRFNTKKILKRTAIFLVVISLIGFFIVPPVIKSLLLRNLSESLRREVTIQSVRFNPFMLSVTVRGFEVKEPQSQKPFVKFDELYLNLQTMSLFRQGIIAREIFLKNPYINIVRNEDLTFNFTDIIRRAARKPAGDRAASALRFSLNNIQITGASVDFMDGPKHTPHTVRDGTLVVPFVSTLPYYLDDYVQPAFSASVNGHAVAFRGSTKPFADSHETHIDLNIRDLDISHYLAYSPFPLNFKFVSGFLDSLSSLSYVQYKDREPTLSLTGRTSFRRIKITDKADALLVAFPRIDLSISSSDLMAKNLHFARVDVQSPELNVALDKDGRLNLLTFMPRQKHKPAEEQKAERDEVPDVAAAKETEKPVIEADEMILSGGEVSVSDASGGRNFSTRLENIEAKVSRFSTRREKRADAEVSFQTDTKEAFRLTGNFSIEPMTAEGNAEASRIVLKKYLPYLDKRINFTIEDGQVNVRTGYQFRQTENGPDARVSGFAAAINSLRLRKTDEKKDFLSIPEASVTDLSADLAKREVVIGDISTQKGAVLAKRYRVGTLLFSTLVKVSEYLEPSAKPGPPQRKQAPEGPWAVTVKRLSLDRYTVTYDDEMPEDPVVIVLEKVSVKGENLSNIGKTRGTLAVRLHTGEKGYAKAEGTVTIEPPSASMRIALTEIPLLSLQSYFADRLRIIVTDGSISSKGTVSFTYTRDGGPGVKYKGEVSLNHFASVDGDEAEDFLKWETLHFDAMDISYAPFAATIGEVALSDFYARVIINEDGSINLQHVTAKSGAGTEEQAKAAGKEPTEAQPGGKEVKSAASPPEADKYLVKIGEVTLQGGTVNFSDHYIKPNFATNMLEIGGRVTGLSSKAAAMADVELRGKLESYAPLEITGRINPLRDDLFIDLTISFRDMDLSPLTPYSGKYLGYTIEKGNLALNLQYLIEKKKLDAQNKILLDQFTLGERVDSPDATKLPVRLAVALLKNRRGEINLNVPVSGRTDDPEFSIFRIVLRILRNILVKVATSPFALLGSLFGGGEELSYVEFDPGMHNLNEQGTKKLDTLVKALNDRPGLKVDIEGHADPEKDKEGLKKHLFDRKVKAQKLKELAKKGGEAVPVDEIKVEPAEYPKYLKAAYKEEKFPKPRNILGLAKDLPVPEMEKLMLTHIEVKEDDLRALAAERALSAKDYILKSGQVEPKRVFLIESKSIPPEKKENVKDSRVDFRLK